MEVCVNSQYSLRYSQKKIRCTGNEEKQNMRIFSHIFSERSENARNTDADHCASDKTFFSYKFSSACRAVSCHLCEILREKKHLF